LYCHADCLIEDVLAALHFDKRDLYDDPRGAEYRYTDPAGNVVRTVHRTPDKRFWQTGNTNGAATTLFRLPEVIAAVRDGQTIYLVEGEKDVLAIEAVGGVATTALQGADSFHKCDVTPLIGGHVVAIRDKDRSGEGWAPQVYEALNGKAATLQFCESKAGKDAADHVAAGFRLDELESIDLETFSTAGSMEDGPASEHEYRVQYELGRIRVKEDARRLYEAEQRPPMPSFDAGTLAEMLAKPPEPPSRVEELIPWEGSTLITAQRKAGKTTLALNLARCLLRGEDFLGRFGVRPLGGIVAMLNFEVSGAQLSRWADEAGIARDRFVLVNLRGRRNPFATEEDRQALAALLRHREVEAVLTDPFSRAYSGASQNDPGEVGAWLADLDRWVRGPVGALDSVLTAHAGWNAERTRGSSALEDWADSIITLVRDDDDQRYLRAMGRDVDVEEDRLTFDPATRSLTLAGSGSRKVANVSRRLEQLEQPVLDVIKAEPGINGSGIGPALREAGVSFQRGDERKAAQRLVDRGLVRFDPGPRNAKCYHPVTSPDLSRPIPVGEVVTYPDPTYIGGIGQQDTSNGDLSRLDDLLPLREQPESEDHPQCHVCGSALWAPDSLQRGTCEKCYRHAEGRAS
jgi:hypothetical protein